MKGRRGVRKKKLRVVLVLGLKFGIGLGLVFTVRMHGWNECEGEGLGYGRLYWETATLTCLYKGRMDQLGPGTAGPTKINEHN